MTTDIFIRTYEKDLEWLKYCLKSISKYVTGYRDIIICIPAGQKHLLDGWNLTKEKIFEWEPVCKDGYIDQQINKLEAHKFTDAEFILFVDSDVCFKRPVHISEYFHDGKPIILKTRYELVGDAICWKKPTEDLLFEIVNFEYMRRLPILYRRDTLINVGNHCTENSIDLSQQNRLSEFNLVGAFAELTDRQNYHFIDTEKEEFGPDSVKQNWSWGGLTPEIKTELEAVTA
jgi:hypothetical protein